MLDDAVRPYAPAEYEASGVDTDLTGKRWTVLACSLAFVWVAGATATLLNRGTGVRLWDTLWAEDGRDFLGNAVRGSLASEVFRPHAGYLQVAPRLVGAIAATFPLPWAATTVAVTSSIVVALLSLYVFSVTRRFFSSLWARFALAAVIVVVPAAGTETTAAANNLHWYLIFAAFWAMYVPPRRRVEVTLASLVIALAMLSDPLTALVLPVGVVRFIQRRDWARAIPIAVGGLAFLGQLVAIANSVQGSYSDRNARLIPKTYVYRVVASFAVGDGWLEHLFDEGRARPAFWVAVLVAALGALVILGSNRRGRVLFMVAAAYSAILAFAAFYLRGVGELFKGGFTLNGSRYTLVPVLFLYAAFIGGLDGFRVRGPVMRWAPSAAFVIWTCIVVCASYSMPSVRTAGPSWSAELKNAEERCAHSHGRPVAAPGDRLPRPGEVSIPIAPNVPPPRDFTVIISCQSVRAER